ncbi:peptidoglycan-binding protein [Thalassorhabdus alkalitolerans]|uniref:Peptidoglycan-binding protein n=2 Tax=Thalassorhabdus alkalitolerans TaxID=2282697 RepID=A0ABW0YM20_9BACI
MISTVFATCLMVGTVSVADAALGDQTLRSGMNNSDVQELQQALKDEGYFNFHTTTNYFGPITRQAVRDFQRSAGITVDGIAGPQTFGALGVNGSSSSSSSSSNSSSSSSSSNVSSSDRIGTIQSNGTLRRGAVNSSVAALQIELKERGHFSGSTGSTYGPRTEQAVRSFQRSAGITADGIAGPQTFRALGGSGSSSNATSSSNSSASSSSSSSSQVAGVSASYENVIRTAQAQTGTRYVWGGTSPSGFDCSGFIQYSFNQHGVSLPRTVAEMWRSTTRVSNPQRGDLVFFETRTGPSHAGIYLGNGQFIHSGASTGVTTTSMSNSYWSQRYLGAGRVN